VQYKFVNYVHLVGTDHRYQNYSVNENRTYDGNSYTFLPFAVSTGAGAKGGERSSTQLAVGLNQVSVNVFAEAVQGQWQLDLKTVSLNLADDSDDVLIRSELWRIASYNMDTSRLVVTLSSPLDAAASDVPRRVLSTELVGALPTSGALVVN